MTDDTSMARDAIEMSGRRQALRRALAALVAPWLGRLAPAAALQPDVAVPDPRRILAQRLADLVIPRTDTAGGADVDAGCFVLMALDERMGSMEPAQLVRVQAALDAAAGGSFLGAPRDGQEALLSALDARAYAGHAPPGTPEADWRHLKAAILTGYYTSEDGASKELRYDPVPGARANITIGSDFRMFSDPGFGGSL
ncbi:MAG: gluconate 2-dehydrogenase subunit 3 family protein [Gammaproteobacteria bacterium]|nr:gluconate 2-dehydrogenase subunit 3 family protein [Gammaproteobacteria bacterium]